MTPASLPASIEEAAATIREVRPDPTPLDPLRLGGGATLLLKREDGPPIHAYKWRGAFNKVASLDASERARGIVAASAGNHAQGVALAAARLGISAKIFMPVPTPLMKQEAVRRLGGEGVEVVLTGDNFDAAAAAALECLGEENRVLVHPYDDPHVIAGQGTIGAEVTAAHPEPIHVAFLQIGGGGMAAGVAAWFRARSPATRLVGVEGVGQASMGAAIAAGRPVELDYVDVFCDGTAVRQAGALTHRLCHELLDDVVTVTNEEVCGAIGFLWAQRRICTEPAGAMGVAAYLNARDQYAGKTALAILCGANMDFAQFAIVARNAALARASRRYFRFTIAERNGTLYALLAPVRNRANIVEFQYGKTNPSTAHPVLGIEAPDAVFAELEQGWRAAGIPFDDVTGQQDVEFRIIPFRADLFRHPLFVRVEFPERAGALAAFMKNVSPIAGICYFNYLFSGERVGRALLGFEFASEADRQKLATLLRSPISGLRSAVPVPDALQARILDG